MKLIAYGAFLLLGSLTAEAIDRPSGLQAVTFVIAIVLATCGCFLPRRVLGEE